MEFKRIGLHLMSRFRYDYCCECVSFFGWREAETLLHFFTVSRIPGAYASQITQKTLFRRGIRNISGFSDPLK